ncbi:MAG: rhodanese-like domain-containing protein [Bacteroidia bacterium]
MLSIAINSCGQMKVESPAFDSLIRPIIPKDISLVDVNLLKESKRWDEFVFLDAREIEEYNVSHLKGAKWVGYSDFSIERVKNIDTSKTIIVYCSVGYRSGKIGERLKANGYKNVLNLYGGIFEWSNSGGEIFNKMGKTNDVHGYDVKWGAFLKRANVVLP